MTTNTAAEPIETIEEQATSPFGYNPVALVTCPHCGGIMQAIDAVKHPAADPDASLYGPITSDDQSFGGS